MNLKKLAEKQAEARARNGYIGRHCPECGLVPEIGHFSTIDCIKALQLEIKAAVARERHACAVWVNTAPDRWPANTEVSPLVEVLSLAREIQAGTHRIKENK